LTERNHIAVIAAAAGVEQSETHSVLIFVRELSRDDAERLLSGSTACEVRFGSRPCENALIA
jgi:hypothetical protein